MPKKKCQHFTTQWRKSAITQLRNYAKAQLAAEKNEYLRSTNSRNEAFIDKHWC